MIVFKGILWNWNFEMWWAEKWLQRLHKTPILINYIYNGRRTNKYSQKINSNELKITTTTANIFLIGFFQTLPYVSRQFRSYCTRISLDSWIIIITKFRASAKLSSADEMILKCTQLRLYSKTLKTKWFQWIFIIWSIFDLPRVHRFSRWKFASKCDIAWTMKSFDCNELSKEFQNSWLTLENACSTTSSSKDLIYDPSAGW